MSAFGRPQPREGFIDARGDYPHTPVITTLDSRRADNPGVWIEHGEGVLFVTIVPRIDIPQDARS